VYIASLLSAAFFAVERIKERRCVGEDAPP
jgi:hypothetical protein